MRLTALTFLLAMFLLTGCGVKPGAVDPPAHEGKDYFPKTYPDPATDPDPQRLIRR